MHSDCMYSLLISLTTVIFAKQVLRLVDASTYVATVNWRVVSIFTEFN